LAATPETDSPEGRPAPRWLHWWAVGTACAALPLVLLGAEVTTKQVGMVDQEGFRAPWHLLTVPLRERGLGYLIEHSHRLAGFVVGACSIVLAVGLYLTGRRPLVRWLGFVALAAVSAQGVLGILRVNWHAAAGPEFALAHGLFAQIVFATLVSVAVMTSRAWASGGGQRQRAGLRLVALLLAALVYAQLAFGALVRHFYDRTAQRLHVLVAFAVVVAVAWAFRSVRERLPADRALRRLTGLLAGLVTFQVMLGVEAWMMRFGAGVPVEVQMSSPGTDLVRSLHYVVGALLFATTVVFTLLVYRPGTATVALPAAPDRRLGGAA
jgi:heme a synthase